MHTFFAFRVKKNLWEDLPVDQAKLIVRIIGDALKISSWTHSMIENLLGNEEKDNVLANIFYLWHFGKFRDDVFAKDTSLVKGFGDTAAPKKEDYSKNYFTKLILYELDKLHETAETIQTELGNVHYQAKFDGHHSFDPNDIDWKEFANLIGHKKKGYIYPVWWSLFVAQGLRPMYGHSDFNNPVLMIQPGVNHRAIVPDTIYDYKKSNRNEPESTKGIVASLYSKNAVDFSAVTGKMMFYKIIPKEQVGEAGKMTTRLEYLVQDGSITRNELVDTPYAFAPDKSDFENVIGTLHVSFIKECVVFSLKCDILTHDIFLKSLPQSHFKSNRQKKP